MNVLSLGKRLQVVSLLVEGSSIRSISRVTSVSKTTILKLLLRLGAACYEYQDKALVNLPSKRVECDEIWAFCGAKEKNAKGRKDMGTFWTWVAMDENKLVINYHTGFRESLDARVFMLNLAHRLKYRIQLTTDSHISYPEAVEEAFGSNVDYGTTTKIFQGMKDSKSQRVIGLRKRKISGKPILKLISTSHIERQNLTMRMSMRRLTRRTNGFSKKLDNLKAALSLHFMYYNFCRIHQTLRVTPAMESNVSDHVWTLEEVINLLPKEMLHNSPPERQKDC